MEINNENIKEILNQINVKPDKNYGQNFLINPAISSLIVEKLNITTADKILEIGPGLGSLSHFLFLKSDNVDLLDIDINMFYFLNAIYQTKAEHIHLGDIRKVDIKKYNKIVSNLPYNLTSEIILYLLKNGENVEKLVLMCEAETFNHFYDVQGKEYGPLSVYIHLLGTIKKEFLVSSSNFYPAPKCKSIVFSIDMTSKKYDRGLYYQVYEFAKSLFLNRRKTIFNNLSSLIKDKKKANDILSKCEINLLLRPENILPQTYLKLFKIYQENK